MIELTQAQYDVLDAIKNYIGRNGYPPTYREIAILTNRASISTIYNHIRLLIKKGYISIQNVQPRTLRLEKHFDKSYIKK